jgi:hypothetical protein
VTDIAVVLDASALLAYANADLAIGELISEVSEVQRQIGVPATCLAQARAALSTRLGAAHLLLLTTSPAVVVLPLAPDGLGRVDAVLQVGEFARAAGGDLALAHAAREALAHGAYLATREPARARELLPDGWPALDLS